MKRSRCIDPNKPYDVVLGVRARRFDGGFWLRGQKEAMVGAGLADLAWFPAAKKRVLQFAAGGASVRTMRERGEWAIVLSLSTPAALEPYDGSVKVPWSECAWQPRRA